MGCLLCCKKKKEKEPLKGESEEEDNKIGPLLGNDTESQQSASIVRKSSTFSIDANHFNTSVFSSSISREDFDEIKLLGRGSFGKVLLVRYKNNGKLYAMKVLKKSVIKRKREEVHTKTERKILEQINHPFIMSLYFAFQDDKKLYLITEFMQGGELFYHLHREKYFSNDKTKFYSAEIVLALEHLHKNNCIYRDLKPENILFDKEGHIKITDFGLSKVMLESSSESKAFTICGTPEYLAPEILENKGYDKSVDWWSLGAVIYEMLVGYSPFKLKKGQQLSIEHYKRPIPLFNHFTPEAKKIIRELLVVDPKKRLGYGKNGTDNIKSHPFFNGINWEDMYNRKIDPPFKPKINTELDLSNFDKFFTNECIVEPESEVNQSELNNNVNDDFGGFTYVHPGVVEESEKVANPDDL